MADPTPEEQEAAKAAAAAEAAAKAQEAAERKTHVKMVKPGEKAALVHPTTVDAHKAVGWKEA